MYPLLSEAFEFLRLIHDVPAKRTEAIIQLEEEQDGYRIIWFGKREPDLEEEFARLVSTAGFELANVSVWNMRYLRWVQKGRRGALSIPLLFIKETDKIPSAVDWRHIALGAGLRIDFARSPHLLNVFEGVDLRELNANVLTPWTLPGDGRKLVADIRGMSPLRLTILERLDLARSVLDSGQIREIVNWVEKHPDRIATLGGVVHQDQTQADDMTLLACTLRDAPKLSIETQRRFYQALLCAPKTFSTLAFDLSVRLPSEWIEIFLGYEDLRADARGYLTSRQQLLEAPHAS